MLRRRRRCAQDELRDRRSAPCKLAMTNSVNRLAVRSADLANRLRAGMRANLWGNSPTAALTRWYGDGEQERLKNLEGPATVISCSHNSE